jgi:hypothetical protein
MRDDMRTMVEVDAMRRGHHRPAFSSRCGWPRSSSLSRRVGLPFLADDLFVNFDDRRAGQASVSSPRSPGSQVLFFTHHPHLVQIAKSVVGAEVHSECALS